MENCNTKDKIILLNEVFSYQDAPLYEKKDSSIKEGLISLGTRFLTHKLTKVDYKDNIVDTYRGILTSKPKLFKYQIADKLFADVFYDYKIYNHKGFLTIEKNQHNFMYNKDFIKDCFINEKTITFNNSENRIILPCTLYDENYETIVKNFDSENQHHYNKIWLHYLKKKHKI